jgi:hypothetical protein
MSDSLQNFIAHARAKGMDHQTIRLLLLSVGWKEKDVARALAAEGLDLPVPLPTDGGSARDAFFHLLMFTTLYATVISLIVLAFDFIARWLPDPAVTDYMYGGTDVSGIRWALAVLIVSFPLFVLLSRLVHRECVAHPEKLASGVRRWLTYLTLFVTACALIGDTVTILFTFLNGEWTVRFILKALSIFVLSALPFWYYFSVLRMESAAYAKSSLHRTMLRISMGIVTAFVVTSILIVGTPLQGRAEKFDEQRISDLRAIREEVLSIVYGQSRYAPDVPKVLPKPLPKTLDEIAEKATQRKLRIVDPETAVPYRYSVKSPSFELCATFALPRDLGYDIDWNHPAGDHCFEFDALDTMLR